MSRSADARRVKAPIFAHERGQPQTSKKQQKTAKYIKQQQNSSKNGTDI